MEKTGVLRQYTVRLDEEVIEALQNLANATGTNATDICRNGIVKELRARASTLHADIAAEFDRRIAVADQIVTLTTNL